MRKILLPLLAFAGGIGLGADAIAKDTAPPEARTAFEGRVEKLPPPARAKASTLIWGAGAAVGDSDGQFANAFVQAGSFAAGDNPTSWTALSINDTDAARAPGNAYWTRSLTGRSQGGYAATAPVVSSPSQGNGVALFDSDFLDNAGVTGAFGTGSGPSPHRGALISPRIDLTGYTDTPIEISLYSRYREFAISALDVSISTDDGGTWSPAVDYRSLIASNVEGFVRINFYGVTAGVANLSQARVRLTFAGDYYYAIVDDLSVRTAVPFDLALGVIDGAGDDLRKKGDVIHVTGNRYFPVSQLGPGVRHGGFGASVRNLGAQTVELALNPRLTVAIERDVGGTWTPVYSELLALSAPIAPEGNLTDVAEFSDTSWMQAGNYRATYTVSLDGVDGDPSNDALSHFFSITPDDYASKVDLDDAAFPRATTAIFPAGTTFAAVEFGSVFYFAAAPASNLTVEAINVTYYVPATFSDANLGPNQSLVGFIYALDPSRGILDQRVLLTQVGVCLLQLTGLGTTVAPGQYGTASCAPVDPGSGNGPVILATGHYYVSLRIAPGLTGDGDTFGSDDVPWFGISSLKNYALNDSLTDVDRVTLSSPVAFTREGGQEEWYWGGFGPSRVPAIGIEFSVGSNLPEPIFDDGFEPLPAFP